MLYQNRLAAMLTTFALISEECHVGHGIDPRQESSPNISSKSAI